MLDEFFSLTAPKTASNSLENEVDDLVSCVSNVSSVRGGTASTSSTRFPSVEEKYFGHDARAKFFERLNFMKRQRNISHSQVGAETTVLNFDNEDMESIDFPFSTSCRPSSPGLDESRYFEFFDDSSNGGDFNACEDVGDGPSVSSLNFSASKSFRTLSTSFAEEFPEPGEHISTSLSPRTRFISECLRENINPRASMIIRKRFCETINLQHLGIGDKMAIIFSNCLRDLPYVSVVNINNNNLTDEGVTAILESIMSLPLLHSLNLSRNKMDDGASDSLARYVQSENCPLTTLIMQSSDIDDFEGERFVGQLLYNHSITNLDLSENKIGHAETLRSSIPNLVTCSESIAQLLRSSNATLKSLNLAWNLIRLDGCMALCQSLSVNTSLTFLDLSYNSLGKTCGEAIGDALMDNRTLQQLWLSNSGINSTACYTLAMGSIENKSLTKLVLDNNPVICVYMYVLIDGF